MINLDDKLEAPRAWIAFPDSDESYFLRWLQRHELTHVIKDVNGVEREQTLADAELLDMILLDWKSVQHSGEAIACTPETRRKFLQRADGSGVIKFSWMLSMALDITNFVNIERTLKNLMRPLSGDLPTQRPPANGAMSAS